MSRKTTKRAASTKKTSSTKSTSNKTRTSSEPASHLSKGASAWKTGAPRAGTAGIQALELVANAADGAVQSGLGGELLELVGTDRLTLGHALAAWQREQDRLANRAWRRPGGLVRPAGL
jgi:hypothetical protein